MMLHVIKSRYLQDYQIWLEFNDGKEGTVDLSQSLWGGMFEPLKDDQALFIQVQLDKELDTHRVA